MTITKITIISASTHCKWSFLFWKEKRIYADKKSNWKWTVYELHRTRWFTRLSLETRYFGDLSAVSKAYNKDLTKLSQKSQYKIPDAIINPKKELQKYLPEHQQISGAEKIAEYFNPQINTSVSFQMFLSGIKKLIS